MDFTCVQLREPCKLCAIAANSAQFRLIPANSIKTFARNSAQLNAIPRNEIPMGTPLINFDFYQVLNNLKKSRTLY